MGDTVNTEQKFCKFCGERIDVECVVCPKCGKQVEELRHEIPQQNVIINNNNTNNSCENYSYRSKVTAIVLCLLLGWLGIHRFYVGKIGTGIIWFITGGCFGIGWIVDFFMILFGAFRDKEGRLLR